MSGTATPALANETKEKRSLLPTALGVAVVVAVVLTVVSVLVYHLQGYDRFDLSRPGFESERQSVANGESDKTYDTASPITNQSLDEFLREFDNRTTQLKSYGDFRDPALSDEELLLKNEPVTQPQ